MNQDKLTLLVRTFSTLAFAVTHPGELKASVEPPCQAIKDFALSTPGLPKAIGKASFELLAFDGKEAPSHESFIESVIVPILGVCALAFGHTSREEFDNMLTDPAIKNLTLNIYIILWSILFPNEPNLNGQSMNLEQLHNSVIEGTFTA